MALETAAAVDDVVPDLERADRPAIDAALEIVGRGVEHCEELKDAVRGSVYARVELEVLERIRREKQKLFDQRRRLESAAEAIEDRAGRTKRYLGSGSEAAASGDEPRGFVADFGGPEPREIAERQAEIDRMAREAAEEVAETYRELRRRREKLFEKKHEEFLKMIRGDYPYR